MSTMGSGTDKARTLAATAFYHYSIRPDKRRLVARYIGLWNEQIAKEALNAFRQALEQAKLNGEPFTLLDDFSDWNVQSPQVTATADQFETEMRPFEISRNAMIIPDAAVRMQVRRTILNFHKISIFATFEEADAWLAAAEA